MPLFERPDESVPAQVAGSVSVLLGLVGWCAVAVGLAHAQVPVFFAIIGGVAAFSQSRSPRATFVIEGAVLSVLLSFAEGALTEWIAVGASVILVGRGLHALWVWRGVTLG